MQIDSVKEMIEAAITECEARVESGDGSHFDVTVISPAFDGLNRVKQQQLVYAALGDSITSGAIHAINIKAYTPAQWQLAAKLQVS